MGMPIHAGAASLGWVTRGQRGGRAGVCCKCGVRLLGGCATPPAARGLRQSSVAVSFSGRRGGAGTAFRQAVPGVVTCGAVPPSKIAVFVSGGGSNFKALHKATLDGRVNGRITVVVSDKADCGGVAYAQANGMRVLRYPAARDAPGDGLSAAQLVDTLREEGIHLVLLAGYLKLVPGDLCRAFPRAMLNIHPALLPAFGGKGMYGHKVHAAVIASGARFSGPTVHFVDEEYDRGEIVAQRSVPVLPDDSPDSLAHRVLEQEWEVYPEVVAALCAGRITWRADGVPIILAPEQGGTKP